VPGGRVIESAKFKLLYASNPPISQFGVFEWQRINSIIDAGDRYAIGKLDEYTTGKRWRKLSSL
jgi:hypothetical protein